MGEESQKRFIRPEKLERLKQISTKARADILRMTKVADSGHPGGSMSSIDILLVLYEFANVWPDNVRHPARDRVVISHGHTSPGVYAALVARGFHDIDEVISTFRLAGSKFEGHIERHLQGIEWTTGNLGQGLSAGCGFALAARLLGIDFHTFVAMSDAEQAKGQVGEARRFAKKYSLDNLTVVIDYNRLQISGWVYEVMPVNIKENYLADGWAVLEIDGHDYSQIHEALCEAVDDGQPTAIIARTVMGKGVSFMENDWEYHGRALSDEEFERAMKELELDTDLSKWHELREDFSKREFRVALPAQESVYIKPGKPRTYGADVKTDNRSAFGKALVDLGIENISKGGTSPIAVFDCDLATSVKVNDFAKKFPNNFFEAGVSEHNTAAAAGALSSQGVVVFFVDFGVFGLDEVYNQQRLNSINATNLKVVVTHCGIDVGQDGRTHHCIDYVGTVRNLIDFKLIVPADPNQTDRAIREAATTHGNFVIAMGRSKVPVITDEEGNPLYGDNYFLEYGKTDVVCEGEDAALLCMGTTVPMGIQVHNLLKEKGLKIKVVNIPCPLDIPEETVREVALTGLIITYEDHFIESGLGAEVAKVMARSEISARLVNFGIRFYAPSGDSGDIFRLEKLDPLSVADKIEKLIRR